MDSTQRARPRGAGSPVGLVIFIILTVVFAVAAYIGFAKYQEELEARRTADSKLSSAEGRVEDLTEQLGALRDAAGAQSPGQLTETARMTLEKTLSQGFGSQAQETASDAMLTAIDAIQELASQRNELVARNQDLSGQVQQLEKQLEATQSTYEEELAEKHAEIQGLQQKIEDVRANLESTIATLREEQQALRNEYGNARDDWIHQERDYIVQIAELKYNLREATGEGAVFEEADARIISIDRMSNKVTVDIGSDAGARPGMRFLVFAKDPSGKVTRKGVVEIIKTAPEISVAQILPGTVKPDTAIGRDDYVYNLAGPEEKLFVFVGEPQEYSLAEWKDFIRANGGAVVDQVRKADQVADYLILGKFEESNAGAIEMIRQARDFGLTIMEEKELKDNMGLSS